MVEVEINKDIRETEAKILGPLTKRQIICISIALGYSAPLFFILSGIEQVAIRAVIAVIAAIPTLACGWCNLYGMHLEQFAVHLVKNVLLMPSKRKYEVINDYEAMLMDLEAEEETKKLEKQKKKGKKKKKK